MMFIYKITGVKYRKLFLTAILFKFSQINLKMIYIQKIGKETFQSNWP